MTTIAVLFHENQSSPDATAIHAIADFWRGAGMSVHYLYGTSEYVPADLLLIHVNQSVVPLRYLKFADRYPVVLNRHITDIRKSAFSKNLLLPDDDWDGQVIVKSDLNYAGAPERRVGHNWLESKSALARRLRAAIERRLPSTAPFADLQDYTVYRSLAEVPKACFISEKVVVERFLPEMEGEQYALRMYLFLGDRGHCIRLISDEPIVKLTNSFRIDVIEPDACALEWQAQHRIDYGKLDYVICNGTPVLLDINKTTGSSPERKQGNRDRDRHLAEGIRAFL